MKVELRKRWSEPGVVWDLPGVSEIPHVVFAGKRIYVHEAGVDARAAAGEVTPIFVEATRLARVFS